MKNTEKSIRVHWRPFAVPSFSLFAGRNGKAIGVYELRRPRAAGKMLAYLEAAYHQRTIYPAPPDRNSLFGYTPRGREMAANPYESPTVGTIARHPRLLMSLGIACLVLAFGGVAATVFGMMVSFRHATSDTASPGDLANGISLALIPSYIGGPLSVVGIVLIIAGFISRRSRSLPLQCESSRETSI